MNRRAVLWMAHFFTSLSIAGCAVTSSPDDQKHKDIAHWHGRLSMQIHANPDESQSPQQSFSAAFALQGTALIGQLTFYNPLGSTAAALNWTPESASLQTQGKTRTFAGLGPLIQQLLGTDLPVAALFAWLSGQEVAADGWEVNLAQFDQGKIMAQRLTPLPRAQLRVILDN